MKFAKSPPVCSLMTTPLNKASAMKKVTLLFFLPFLLCLGCASTPPKPKYTVFTPEHHKPLPADYTALSVRLADDIRSAPNPLCFHADGRVTLCRELTYYAPIEVAITRALQDTFSMRKEGMTAHKPLRVVVRTFGVDARSGAPKAVVHIDLPAEQLDMRIEEPLPGNYTAQDLRDALGKALLQCIESACESIAQPTCAQ